MAHHQHHGAAYDAQVSRSLESRPHGPSSSHMPSISEDEFANELDEPPDHLIHSETFAKTRPSSNIRRQSLLTKALHTDSESHDEQPLPNPPSFTHLPSVSSTCSNFSSRSHDFTSDDGLISPSTRASTPGSPQSILHLPKQFIAANQVPKIAEPSRALAQSADEAAPPPKEPTVEAQLGRKRCITFACGGSTAPVAKKEESPPRVKAPEPAKRPCVIKFNCPFTSSKSVKAETTRVARHLSPAPSVAKTNPFGLHRRHRDSDSTIKSESPKAPQVVIPEASKAHRRRPSNLSDLGRTEACRFHEFASSDEEVQEWTQQSTCYKSRLTVNDTLKQENHIRQLAEEADEEEAEEGARGKDHDDMAIDEDVEDFSDDVSDEGFQTDDEDGFAESDDDDDDDSDYEWWAPRRTRAASPYVGSAVFRPVIQRNLSDSSLDLSDQEQSLNPQRGRRRVRRSVEPVTIRSGTPELPDSTDFVCGTLDEDRPIEQAYISRINERKAAKHRTTPQDIDPSFPTSDPEIENDDEEDDDDEEEYLFGRDVNESDNAFLHGRLETTDRDEPRGRRKSPVPPRSPKVLSPKRLRSPPPPTSSKKGALPKSPCPKGMFYKHSPARMRSPPPSNKLTSPPPSRRGSTASGIRPAEFSFDHTFLASRDQNVTHTSSLPRSPHPFIRRRKSSTVECEPCMAAMSDEDEGESTEHAKPYTRGAIDIAQGLERKRLKRREKFYKQYLKKEEKKKARRPLPGKGAQRMRQVGLECATLRGKRMLSI